MHEVATMGCRTRVFENRFGEKTSVGRGNLSFTTVNIVRLAIEVMPVKDPEERIRRFFEKLDEVLDITALQLEERFNFQKTALAIGFIGLAECLIALTGKHHGESEESQTLGLKIVGHIRNRANEFSGTYRHNYSVLATPAEGLAGKFTRKDRKTFGIIPGITDKDYYTNSSHVPVYYPCSPRHKAKVEAPYHELTAGGHIFYVEIDGDATHNEESIMQIVDLMDKYNMGYGSVNHNRNRCHRCGYENAEKEQQFCPKCGSRFETIQRITGYLVGTTDRWNSGKLAELHDRVIHK